VVGNRGENSLIKTISTVLQQIDQFTHSAIPEDSNILDVQDIFAFLPNHFSNLNEYMLGACAMNVHSIDVHDVDPGRF
jgi:hypothetical protein